MDGAICLIYGNCGIYVLYVTLLTYAYNLYLNIVKMVVHIYIYTWSLYDSFKMYNKYNNGYAQ